MGRIGLLTFSDGRPYVHELIREFALKTEVAVASALTRAGHEVVRARAPISSSEVARSESRFIADQRPDLTIFNYPVWAFPHFTMIAATETPGELLLLSNIDPVQPGMVGMLAAGGGLDQIGRRHGRLWGDIADPGLVERILVHIRASKAIRALRGSTFGLFGGRPMGMYTAVANTDQWRDQFGIDVEHIDQWEIVRRADCVDAGRVRAGREWFEKHATVHYDGKRLTPELLERQLRSYLAVRELIAEWDLDFSGIKGQPELTTHFATMDVTEALLNDPYDWEGPKPTHVTATEADMDGALTMQILKGITGLPVLFADVRHYHADRDIWDLANSGQHATWYAARGDDPAVNLARVHLYPEVFFFPAGGASVHHIAAAGPCTLARLTRSDGRYRLQVVRARLEDYGSETNEALARQSTFEWPHAFARMEAPASEFLSRFGSNHIHGVPGDVVPELREASRMLDVKFELFGQGSPSHAT